MTLYEQELKRVQSQDAKDLAKCLCVVLLVFGVALLFDSAAWGSGSKHHNVDAGSTAITTTAVNSRGGDVSFDDNERKRPASSAAALNIDLCMNGASGQAMSWGASLGLSDPFCKMVAAVYVAQTLCAAQPMVPVACGGGDGLAHFNDHPDYDPGLTTNSICSVQNFYCGTLLTQEPQEWIVATEQPDECKIVNPACADAMDLWDDVKTLTKAELGVFGWRAWLGGFLPNAVRWLF